MSMWRSPHKREIRRSLRVRDYKTAVSGNKTGNSGGHKGGIRRTYVKRGDVLSYEHDVPSGGRPAQPPGYPSGKCLGGGKEGSCRCGKHNSSAARKH